MLLWWFRRPQQQVITVTGAVVRQESEPGKQLPIADVDVTAVNGLALHGAKSDASGFFRLTLIPGVKPGQPVTLKFVHPGYKPLELTEPAGKALYLARMSPSAHVGRVVPSGRAVSIEHVTVRYTLRTTVAENIGSAVKSVEVANQGNVPCEGHSPCSPDGRWRATVTSVSLDAGEGNEFQDPTVSCIAGPCPFTKVESDQLSPDGRRLQVSIRNWSDTATFLVQASVMHRTQENLVRRLYPVIFNSDLNFTLPAEAEGPSIEAEMDGASIVFPLGPDLCLSWADCRLQVEQDQSHSYRCELKPGYQFR